jgi:hypothetical protein
MKRSRREAGPRDESRRRLNIFGALSFTNGSISAGLTWAPEGEQRRYRHRSWGATSRICDLDYASLVPVHRWLFVYFGRKFGY